MRGKDLCNATELNIRQDRLKEASAQANALVREYPGHLRGLFLLGVTSLRLGDLQQARLRLDAALGLDPENAECRLALAETLRRLGEAEQATRQFVRSFALFPSEADYALVVDGAGDKLAELKSRGEASPMGKASRYRLAVNWGHALSAFQAITRSDPFLPEAWLGLAESLWRLDRLDEASATLDQIAAAWPNFIKASLIAGDILIRQGQVEAGTVFLHNAQTLDPSGVVAQRTLAWQGNYAHLWADNPTARYPQSGAAHRVSHSPTAQSPAAPAVMGSSDSPTIREIELELKRLSDDLLKCDEADAPPRPAPTPALVVLSCRSTLERNFGPTFVERLGEAVHDLVRSIGLQEDRAIHFVALDDPEQMRGLGAESPEDPTNPEQVRVAVESLGDGLLTQNNDLRHLLILGGDDIVPFCRVPNPTDDQDEDIYTDAPYGARNGSYLLPTRAVGRLPDSGDAEYLLRLIEHAAQAHRQGPQAEAHSGLKALKRFLQRPKARETWVESVGYTASVWKEAARAVFETIGDAKHLRMSPPLTSREFSGMAQGRPRYSYFNLHGVEGEAVWYGQRDPNFSADYPLFPIALTPAHIAAASVEGTTVFTEACYGADILERTPQDSIALKFLAEGARAVIGATRLAYGSLTPPLAGADLLARFFWLAVLSGMSIGQSLQWAKLSFANDLLNRQGYLDSEDQKTLLAFNLFGDPTLAVEGQLPIWDKLPQAALMSKSPVVCCTRNAQPLPLPALPAELVNHVESEIAHRMPWLTPKQMKVIQQFVSGDLYSGRSADSARQPRMEVANRYVFSVNGTLQSGDDAKWHQIVKVTVDPKGTILKMAVSK